MSHLPYVIQSFLQCDPENNVYIVKLGHSVYSPTLFVLKTTYECLAAQEKKIASKLHDSPYILCALTDEEDKQIVLNQEDTQTRLYCIQYPLLLSSPHRVVTPYCPKGDLFDFFTSQYVNVKKVLPWSVLRGIAFQLVTCLHHLHSRKMYHHDVKLEQFLICEKGTILLGDLETVADMSKSRNIDSSPVSDIWTEFNSLFSMTDSYTPPEQWAVIDNFLDEHLGLYQCDNTQDTQKLKKGISRALENPQWSPVLHLHISNSWADYFALGKMLYILGFGVPPFASARLLNHKETPHYISWVYHRKRFWKWTQDQWLKTYFDEKQPSDIDDVELELFTSLIDTLMDPCEMTRCSTLNEFMGSSWMKRFTPEEDKETRHLLDTFK